MNLIGFKGGYPYVVFEDITEFESISTDTIIFEEDDVIYVYRRSGDHYVEIHSKGPVFDSYSLKDSVDMEDYSESEWDGETCGHYQTGGESSSYSSSYDPRDHSCFCTLCGGGSPTSYYSSCGGGC